MSRSFVTTCTQIGQAILNGPRPVPYKPNLPEIKHASPSPCGGGLGAFRRYVASLERKFAFFNGNYWDSFAPRAQQADRASASGASWQMTLLQTSSAPSPRQVSSQVDIHSPSPQP